MEFLYQEVYFYNISHLFTIYLSYCFMIMNYCSGLLLPKILINISMLIFTLIKAQNEKEPGP